MFWTEYLFIYRLMEKQKLLNMNVKLRIKHSKLTINFLKNSFNPDN